MTADDPTLSFITPRVAAGVLFTDEQHRILMVVPTYKDYYDIPGGYVEHGEAPYHAARREVFEELGIKPPIGRLLVADWWQESPENENGPKLLLVFDGGQLTEEQHDRIRLDGDEVSEYVYQDSTKLEDVTIRRLANRLSHAIAARLTESTVYLEDGQTAGTDFQPTEVSRAAAQLVEIERMLDDGVGRQNLEDLTLVQRVQDVIVGFNSWSELAIRRVHEIHRLTNDECSSCAKYLDDQ